MQNRTTQDNRRMDPQKIGPQCQGRYSPRSQQPGADLQPAFLLIRRKKSKASPVECKLTAAARRQRIYEDLKDPGGIRRVYAGAGQNLCTDRYNDAGNRQGGGRSDKSISGLSLQHFEADASRDLLSLLLAPSVTDAEHPAGGASFDDKGPIMLRPHGLNQNIFRRRLLQRL